MINHLCLGDMSLSCSSWLFRLAYNFDAFSFIKKVYCFVDILRILVILLLNTNEFEWWDVWTKIPHKTRRIDRIGPCEYDCHTVHKLTEECLFMHMMSATFSRFPSKTKSTKLISELFKMTGWFLDRSCIMRKNRVKKKSKKRNSVVRKWWNKNDR